MDVQRAPAVVHRHVGRINSTPSKASNFCHTGCFLPALGGNEKNCGTRVMADLMLFARCKNIGDDRSHRLCRGTPLTRVLRNVCAAACGHSYEVEFQTDASLTRPASSRVKIDVGTVGLSNFPSGAAEGKRAGWDFEGCKKSWISARQFISLGSKKELLVLV